MIDALYVAETGLQAGQKHIDTISNNMANLNTTAYKKGRIEFRDLVVGREVTSLDETGKRDLVSIGNGTQISRVWKEFQSGDLKATENPLDLAIRGGGFFEVLLENGEVAYTRNGAMKVDEDGYLGTLTGYRFSDMIQIPPDAKELEISQDGTVTAYFDNDSLEIGQIQLAGFMNAQGLDSIGQGIYVANDESGNAIYSDAGENGIGILQQGYLESSNVDLVKELVELVTAQRGYQACSHVIRAADEIMQITNDLRG
ncbi:flagellar basal-body rod protein FlgG [Hahella ganghwensis]|uniref:flagellar basal-body rod protein FlgG n=1 Tax=Hahella ganghwensis TaxID=286420 RepID=UPI000367EDCA|nr:flagellar basal-body rod protein FlgG [Hahella ganghwensis]